MLWSASAVFAPIGILSGLYYRIVGLAISISFAGLALLLAALFAVATEAPSRRAHARGCGERRAVRNRSGRGACARPHDVA